VKRATLWLLLAVLAVLALPIDAATQVNTLCAVQLDPPVEGVRICWQTRCYETDATGRWAHTITVTAGSWYEFVADDSVQIVGVRAPSNAYATLSDGRVRFKFNTTPASNSGPFVVSVEVAEATPTAPATGTIAPTAGAPTATCKPTLQVDSTATPTATPAWDPNQPLPYEVRAVIEQAALEAMYSRLLPPVTLYELVQSPIWAVANTHSGLLAVWCADPSVGYGSPSNWRIAPGAPLSGPFVVEAPIGEIECIAFANGIYCRLGMQYYALQWGGFALARLSPSMVWEVE